MKKIFRRKKKSASEAGSIGSGLSGSAYNVSPKKDLGKLHRAAFEGNLTDLKKLLKRGDVNQLDKENRTPLHLACANGKYEGVRMLCAHQNINLNLCDNERRSALMKCVQCEHQTCLKILLDKDADVSLSDINGNTALHVAASIPNSDICYLLSDYNADPRAKNKDGATPLHIASSLGSDEIVKLLLGLGVNIDDIDENEKTPLMNAAQKGHLTTVKLLLSKNANSALRDLNGWTADDYASMDGFHPISHVILEHNSKKGMSSNRQSTMSRTPQTTPQKLGLQAGAAGGPALDSDDESQEDDSFSASRATNDKDSWASSQSDDEEPKYAKIQKKNSKPKINIMQALNLRKKNAETTSPAPTNAANVTLQSQLPPQSPSKATTSLFLTASAREQLKKQESEEGQENENFQEQEMRNRYDSKSSRGLPVSPAKPPLPKPRSATSVDEMDSPGPKYTPSKPTDDDSPWDSSGNESDEEPQRTTPAAKVAEHNASPKPDQKLMQELGFDASTTKNIYDSEDESHTEQSHSEAAPAFTSPTKTKDTLTVKKVPPGVKQKRIEEDSDSWDDSFSEKNASAEKKGGSFNFLQGSSALKFDDETDSEADVVRHRPTTNTAIKPNQLIKDEDDDDDSSSWNSDNLVKRPEDTPARQEYVSSPPAVLKDAERMASPVHKPALQQKIAEHEQEKGLGILYGSQLSDEDSGSEIESESSWEHENRVKKQQTLNNEKDLEKERKKQEEEKRRIREEEIKKKQREEEERRREAEEQRKLDEKRKEEARLKEERRKKEAEEQRRLEEKRRKEAEEEKRRRDLEELEKLNQMNEALEKKNAELKRKAQEEEKRKREEEDRKKLEATKTTPLNESLRVALERAADVTSESGDSDQGDKKSKSAEKKITQSDYLANSSAPVPITGPSTTQHKAPFGGMNQVDLDTLTEETETDDDLSLSESHPPALMHTSPLSDSLKLAEEKQNLSLQLVKEQDASAVVEEKLNKIQKENKQLKLKERTLMEEKKTWELDKVEFNAKNRELSFDVKNLEESLETLNLKLSKQDERAKRMDEQLHVEREERKEQEVLVRDLRIELKNSNAAMKQAELECEELRKTLETERHTQTLAQTMKEDNFKLNETLQNEALKDNKVESLEKVIHEKNQELIKVKAERDRYEDASARYKSELGKLRSTDADQHGNLVQLNQELNERLDEKEVELRESEEALQLTALQSVQFKQAYENSARQVAEEKREKENIAKDLEMLNNQQAQLKRDLEDSRSSYLREQERTRKLEDSQERMREREADQQAKLLSAETRASRLENEVQIAQSSNKQRTEDTAKWENECEKLREASRENEKKNSKLQREIAEQSGKVEALKIELHQRESECVQMRQEKEDMRSRNSMSATEQQDKFSTKLTALQREHENERVAFETRNVQLTQQIEHWKSEVDRTEREKTQKDEELAQAQQDRIETHKKLGYADAFSKSASKEQKQLMEENTRVKEDNIRLQSQVSLLEQKVEEKSSTISDLQKEVDRFYQTSSNANRKIDSLNESQRLVESSRAKVEQQLKDIELENIRLKSELDSANSWKDRLQESREEEAHAKATLEEKVSRLECDKVLIEEKLAAEVANAKILHSEAEGHKSMWEGEVKSRSKLEVELSKAAKEVEDERVAAESSRNKLTRALEDRKTYKTKYEQLKREQVEANRRAESYRSAMHDAGRKAADTESECESQLSLMDEQHNADMARGEATIAKLREQVADLSKQMKEKRRPYFPEGPTESSIGADEIKRAHFENEKLREELKQLRGHVKDSYVDKSELEAARQEERIKAQSAIAPTLDQVNSFLKNQQLKYDFLDQVREKREEGTMMGAAMRIAALEEQLKTERRRNENAELRRFHQEDAQLSQRFDSMRRENDVLKQQLSRATNKSEEYKGYWIKERKKFQNFFSNTLGGSLIPNGTDTANLSATNGMTFSPGNITSSPLGGAFSSTPKKDPSDPILAQLRSKLDATIAQHLSAARDSPMSHSAPPNVNGHLSPRSSNGTPRSDQSSHHHDIASTSGHKPTQNEYMSFLLT